MFYYHGFLGNLAYSVPWQKEESGAWVSNNGKHKGKNNKGGAGSVKCTALA